MREENYLVNVADDFGSGQVLQFALINIQNFVGHFQIILIRWRAIQLDFIIASLDNNDNVSV